MKAQFSFKTRQAMAVATAVAEEIENNPAYSGSPTATNAVRPTLLSICGTTFRFEGGTVINVHMVDMDTFTTESWCTPHMQDWVVTHADVRYRPYRPYADSPLGDKISQTWEANKLSDLKTRRPWYHPHVVDASTITGTVGVFVNNAAGEGYISVDPERNQEGHYTMYEAVEYRRFVEGDLNRAEHEARTKLQEFLA